MNTNTKSIPDQILTMLRRGQRRRPITAREVAERLDIDRRVASTALGRLHERGDLTRESVRVGNDTFHGYVLRRP